MNEWINRQARVFYDEAVAMYSRGFGEDNAHLVVGNLCVALFIVATLGVTYMLFEEVSGFLVKVLRIVALLVVVLAFVSVLIEVTSFVYRSDETKAAAKKLATEVVNQSTSTMSEWLQNLVGIKPFRS